MIANTLLSEDKREPESSENIEVMFGPDESNTESELLRGSHLNYIDSEPSDKRESSQQKLTNDLPYLVRPSAEESFEVQRIESVTKHHSVDVYPVQSDALANVYEKKITDLKMDVPLNSEPNRRSEHSRLPSTIKTESLLLDEPEKNIYDAINDPFVEHKESFTNKPPLMTDDYNQNEEAVEFEAQQEEPERQNPYKNVVFMH